MPGAWTTPSIVLVLCSTFVGVAGCSDATGPELTFAVTGPTQTLAAVPWPSDLLLDSAGHVALAKLPLDDTGLGPSLLDDLSNEQDGFGVTSGAYFPVGRYVEGVSTDPNVGAVDASSLSGSAKLVPLACADGSAPNDPLPVSVHLRSHDRPQRIYVRPAQGVVLRERCTYAYVISTQARTDRGALGASADLRALLDDGAPESRLARAYELFAPLRGRLAAIGLSREQIAGATVFTTHALSRDYIAARAALAARAKPTVVVTHVFARTKTGADDGALEDLFGTPAVEEPGDDVTGGLSHDGIEYVVHGRFETPDYLGGATVNGFGVHATVVGYVEHDAGAPKVKGTVLVPFTLVIPTGADLTKLPFAVVQHGLGSLRRRVMSIANTLAQRGIASILVDLPFHGGRAADATDVVFDFTKAAGSDGFPETMADASYGFFDTKGNTAAGVPALAPRAIRSAFFQSVSDILQAFRVMRDGDLSAIGAREPRLASLAIDADHEVYVGDSFGSMIGTIVAAFEQRLEGAVLNVGGGGLIFPLLLNSADYGPIFGTLLNATLGTDAGATDDPRDTDWGYNLAQFLLEGGDALAFAPYVIDRQASWDTPGGEADRAAHVLQTSAFHDELVPNQANLSLARGLGLAPLTLADGVAPDLSGWDGATTEQGALMGNHAGRTAAFVQFRQATHYMMLDRMSEQDFDFDGDGAPVFPARTTPTAVANPIDRVHGLVADFVGAVLKGETPEVK